MANKFIVNKAYGDMNYHDYINSWWWYDKRKIYLEQRELSCDVCGSKENLVVHHLHYKTIGNERSNDLMLVCKWCHNCIHKNLFAGSKSKLNFDNTKEKEIND